MQSKTELTDWALARLKGKIWQIRRIWAGRAFSFWSVTNSKLNRALRSKGTDWALGLTNSKQNRGFSRSEKGGEAFRFCFF